MESVKVRDREFELFIPQKTIEEAIDKIAKDISRDLDGKEPLFVCVLNGSFMFAGDLFKKVNIEAEVTFVKLSSFSGTSSTGVIKEIFGLNDDISDRTVVIVEDIVDSGHTISLMMDRLQKGNPKEIKVATLLLKPDALKVDVKVDYVALEIPNDFILGYGLDYYGFGRNLPNIYKIKS